MGLIYFLIIYIIKSYKVNKKLFKINIDFSYLINLYILLKNTLYRYYFLNKNALKINLVTINHFKKI
jgi:hypothetical protein